MCGCLSRVSWGDWLWKPANVSGKSNSAADIRGGSLCILSATHGRLELSQPYKPESFSEFYGVSYKQTVRAKEPRMNVSVF